jgi:hypothetical protein
LSPFTKKEASFILCASPPESVEEDCPIERSLVQHLAMVLIFE